VTAGWEATPLAQLNGLVTIGGQLGGHAGARPMEGWSAMCKEDGHRIRLDPLPFPPTLPSPQFSLLENMC
jgi:hypothetical protein